MIDIDEYIVKNSKPINEGDSHAACAMIKLSNAKLVTKFVQDFLFLNDKEKSLNYWSCYLESIFNYKTTNAALEKRYLNFSKKIIFDFRNVIEPVSWFYSIDESYPEPIKFIQNKNRTSDELNKEKTVGKFLFEKLAKSYPTYQTFSDEYKIPLFHIKNMLTTRTCESNGKIEIRYKTFVTKSVIKLLREEIHPDYWFIFPEELSKEDPAYKKIFND